MNNLDAHKSGRIWASHWTEPNSLFGGEVWQSVGAALDAANLTRLSERQMILTARPGAVQSLSNTVSVLHWYCQWSEAHVLRAFTDWLMRKSGLRVRDQLSHTFPNPGHMPDGLTVSYLVEDGCYRGRVGHVLLAESHLAAGPHFTLHTFPISEHEGVVYGTLVSWNKKSFLRAQKALGRWGLGGGIVVSAQFDGLDDSETLFTLACCSETGFRNFQEWLCLQTENQILMAPDEALPLPRDMLGSLKSAWTPKHVPVMM